MCWTSASGERKLVFEAMQSAAPAAEKKKTSVHLLSGLNSDKNNVLHTEKTQQPITAYLGQSNLNLCKRLTLEF